MTAKALTVIAEDDVGVNTKRSESVPPTPKPRASTMQAVREDYRNHTVWSYAECADFAGVKVGTICKWVSCGKRDGRKITPLPVAFRRGLYRIDALVFQKYLRKKV